MHSAEPVICTAFIGLGSQGGPMAMRMLQSGFPLTVWARRSEVLTSFTDAGATAAGAIADLGRIADYVGLCVVDDSGVAQVCDELIPAMRAGSLLAIHSTILPETCEALAARCAAKGIAFVDAPVSGGGGAAASGSLTVMCGGTVAHFEQARPILESFAGTLLHLGPAGAGQRAKIVNNALMAANMGLAHAALSAGEALGIERCALAELIGKSSGRSFGFEVYSRLPEPGAFRHGAQLLAKDVGLLAAITEGRAESEVLTHASDFFLRSALAGA